MTSALTPFDLSVHTQMESFFISLILAPLTGFDYAWVVQDHVTPTCWLAVLLRKKLMVLELTVTVMAEIEGEGYKRESL